MAQGPGPNELLFVHPSSQPFIHLPEVHNTKEKKHYHEGGLAAP